MLLSIYIQAAMKRANYELLEDGSFYGEIHECPGVWGNATTLELCQEDLQDALEGWIILGLRLGHTLPNFDTTNPDREKLTKIQEFRQSCLRAGMEAETMGLTEEQIENNIEQIKQEVYQEIYGEHSYS